MEKRIVTLSDTSHPFTTITNNTPRWEQSWQNDPKHNNPDNIVNADIRVDQDNIDNPTRALTTQEFDAIRTFQSNWGYTDNGKFGSDLVDMLADTTTDTNTAIHQFMRKWDLYRENFGQIRTDLQNLYILRITVMPDSSYAIPKADTSPEYREWMSTPSTPTFTPEEVKALESLSNDQRVDEFLNLIEGEKSDEYSTLDETLNNWDKVEKSAENLRKELFQEESDKRVNRYFIGRSGWVWFVHFIVDMPEFFDEIEANMPKSLYEAKDGMTTLHMTNLYMSESEAWDAIEADIRYVSKYDPDFLSHVYDLDKM